MPVNISAKIGQTFSLLSYAKTPEGLVYDLTGFTLTSRIFGPSIDKTYTVGDGIVIINALTGEYRIDVSLAGSSKGEYKLDVKYTDGSVVNYSDLLTINVSGVITA